MVSFCVKAMKMDGIWQKMTVDIAPLEIRMKMLELMLS